MGLLYGEKLEPQPYAKTKQYQKIIKENAMLQVAKLLTQHGQHQKKEGEALKYGTEVEIFIFEKKTFNNKDLYTVTINDQEFMSLMKSIQIEGFEIQPEFAKFVKEMVPTKPFEMFLEAQQVHNHFNLVYSTLLKQNKFKVLFGGSNLPFLGSHRQHLDENDREICPQQLLKQNKFSQSNSYNDLFITEHSRFKSFTLNTRLRRQDKVQIKIPVYQDVDTKIDNVQFDHFGFGMSSCALQITYSTKNLDQARWLYDQFHVLSPFFLAASATASVVANKLLAIDSRFPLINQSTDDRNPRERIGLDKPKYSTANYYISNDKSCKNSYNDVKYTINKSLKKKLRHQLKQKNSKFAGDDKLLNHFSYHFIRDVLVVFPDLVKRKYDETTLDYDAINSCNWNDVRLKPPGNFNPNIGWLVEFRPMDIPITNREKTAMVFMSTLFQRMIVDPELGVNFYIPISQVDENFQKSIANNAFLNTKIKVRKYFSKALHGDNVHRDDTVMVTYQEFLEGSEQYDGMRKLVQRFIELNESQFAKQTEQNVCSIKQTWQIFEFFVAKAKGKLLTGAQYIRKFIIEHPLYKQNSEISDELCSKLIDHLMIVQEKDESKEMLGDYLDFLFYQLKFINFTFLMIQIEDYEKFSSQLQIINKSDSIFVWADKQKILLLIQPSNFQIISFKNQTKIPQQIDVYIDFTKDFFNKSFFLDISYDYQYIAVVRNDILYVNQQVYRNKLGYV